MDRCIDSAEICQTRKPDSEARRRTEAIKRPESATSVIEDLDREPFTGANEQTHRRLRQCHELAA